MYKPPPLVQGEVDVDEFEQVAVLGTGKSCTCVSGMWLSCNRRFPKVSNVVSAGLQVALTGAVVAVVPCSVWLARRNGDYYGTPGRGCRAAPACGS